MRLLIYILFPLSLFGQIDTSSAEAILKANDYRVYDAPHWTKFPNPMPWQSLVHSFHQHVQIDYIVNTKELEVLTSDRHIVLRDLKKFYYGYSKDSFESSLTMSKRSWPISIAIPSLLSVICR
mgnify:CR=1 FL=1